MTVISDINPRPRGRHGFAPLTLSLPPRPEEMAFDKVGLRMRATMGALVDTPSRDVFERYRAIMIEQARSSHGLWSMPTGNRAVFGTKLNRSLGTITSAAMWVRWEDDAHTMHIWLNVNPTRTLRHLLTRFPDVDYPGAWLESLTADEFFGINPDVQPTPALDGNDNVLDNVALARERMGEDYAAAFIGMFERQLRKWVGTVVAPPQAGFQQVATGLSTRWRLDWLGVELDWSSLNIRDAEVYIERRQLDAAHVMNRVSHAVLAGHEDCQYHLHELGELGGRSGGSTSVSVRPTQGITLAYYAKAAERIRGEVRYSKSARKVAQGVPRDISNPLQHVLNALRNDAVPRLRWEQFCGLAASQPVVTAADLARLAALVTNAAHRSKVDAERVLRELLETGGITETVSAGDYPMRLNRLLVACGVLCSAPLVRRSRPGHPRRYSLEARYLEVVRLIQRGFVEGQPSA